jgi:hypothetical protein
MAQRIRKELGANALSFVSLRVEEARQAGDIRGVDIWNEVAEMLANARREAKVSATHDESSELWKFMQRVEHCRHRAMQLERRAASGLEALRQDTYDLAMQWRDLALQIQLMAQLSKN